MTLHIDDIRGFSGHPWPQYQEELAGFLALLKAEQVMSYLEVGCRYGDTWHAVGLSLPAGSRVVAVDLPGAKSGLEKKGGHADSGHYLHRAADDLRAFGMDAHVIIGNSHLPSTMAAAAAFGPYDAILIDGDHSAPGVQKDWEAYGPLGRLVAFHDIAGAGKHARAIRPIYDAACKGRKHQEFIFDGNRRGIGVIWRTD